MQEDNDQSNWQFTPDKATTPLSPGVSRATAKAPDVNDDSITWTASEYVAHEKSASWYLLMILAALVVDGLMYLLTRDVISVVAISVLFVTVAIYANKKPRALQYTISHSGVRVGNKEYSYQTFRGFAESHEGAIACLTLLPARRFMLPLSLYYDPEDEDRIVDVLSTYLPLEELKPDAVERFSRRIRF